MYIVGMMSGTSLDGVDAVLAKYHDGDDARWGIVAHAETDIPPALRQTLYQLNFPRQVDNELHTAKIAEQQLTACYGEAYRALLAKTTVAPEAIEAIAAHGQTIRHAPNDDFPYTLQLLNGALLSHLTQQTVVCDFRSKDVAAGGQGAPFAPLFHRELFAQHAPFVVVNIGGISNMSLITDEKSSGFDCGPGNCLLDEWVEKHCHQPFDKDAAWARQGRILPELLAHLLQDDYFRKQPPKSTGRDYFHQRWLTPFLQGNETPADVMRTLVKLTAVAIADCVPATATAVVVVGGGAKNPLLLADMRELLPHQSVIRSEDFSIDAQHVEALGFAMLGRATLLREPLDTRAVTGAQNPLVLGAIYSA